MFWDFEQYLAYLLTVLWPQKNGRTQQINVRFCIRDFLFLSYYKELARIKFSQMLSLQICFFFHFVTLFVKETIFPLNLLGKQFRIVTFPRKFARNSHFFQWCQRLLDTDRKGNLNCPFNYSTNILHSPFCSFDNIELTLNSSDL